MKPLKSVIKKDAALLLDLSINAIFTKLHKKYKTSSGDISPYQQYVLDDVKEQLIDSFNENTPKRNLQ
jgi:hypothetical protein